VGGLTGRNGKILMKFDALFLLTGLKTPEKN
jgi:hypothetical protein